MTPGADSGDGMATYVVRERDVTVHAHPLSMRHFRGVPVSVEVDGQTQQVTPQTVTICGGDFEVEETVTFRGATVEFDPDSGVANITPA